MGENREQPLLPDFDTFTFQLDPSEQKKYEFYTPRAVKTIKYLQSLDKTMLLGVFSEVKEYARNRVWGPNFRSLQHKIGGGLTQIGWQVN
jgi:hypothetical protein